MSDTLTAVQTAQAQSRITWAMMRLFECLRPFVHARPMRQNDKMPEHEIIWMTDIDGGPDRVVAQAIAESPELWAHALPAEVCIVPREMLTWQLGAATTEMMAGYGANIVASCAARARYDADQKELVP